MISKHGLLPSSCFFSFFIPSLAPAIPPAEDALVARSNNKYSVRYFRKTSLEIIAAVPAELADFPRSLLHSGIQFVRNAHFASDALPLSTATRRQNSQIRWGRYYHGCGEIYNPQTYRRDQSRWFPAVFLLQVAGETDPSALISARWNSRVAAHERLTR